MASAKERLLSHTILLVQKHCFWFLGECNSFIFSAIYFFDLIFSFDMAVIRKRLCFNSKNRIDTQNRGKRSAVKVCVNIISKLIMSRLCVAN